MSQDYTNGEHPQRDLLLRANDRYDIGRLCSMYMIVTLNANQRRRIIICEKNQQCNKERIGIADTLGRTLVLILQILTLLNV